MTSRLVEFRGVFGNGDLAFTIAMALPIKRRDIVHEIRKRSSDLPCELVVFAGVSASGEVYGHLEVGQQSVVTFRILAGDQ